MVIAGILRLGARQAWHPSAQTAAFWLARQSPYGLILVAQAVLLLILDPITHSRETFDLAARLFGYARFVMLFVPICLLAICFERITRPPRPKHPSLALAREIARYLTDRERLLNGLPILLLLGPFMAMFAFVKANIPVVSPFSWDETFSQWDRALFFGHLPFEWLLPVFGHPAVLLATNVAYAFWFGLMWITMLACAFMRSATELRTRYLLSFFLVWFLEGNVLALALSSAGPCYYGLLGLSPDPYAPLLAVLREAEGSVPLWSLTTQAHLWRGYLGETAPLGISAMPSLHNAICVLMALGASRLDRRLGLVFWLYALWIFLGSVALAWHYAVDGLVALPATLAIWVACGRFAAWWHRGEAGAAMGSAVRLARP